MVAKPVTQCRLRRACDPAAHQPPAFFLRSHEVVKIPRQDITRVWTGSDGQLSVFHLTLPRSWNSLSIDIINRKITSCTQREVLSKKKEKNLFPTNAASTFKRWGGPGGVLGLTGTRAFCMSRYLLGQVSSNFMIVSQEYRSIPQSVQQRLASCIFGDTKFFSRLSGNQLQRRRFSHNGASLARHRPTTQFIFLFPVSCHPCDSHL